MTVDSANGTAESHQIECAEPSPSECVKTASVYTPFSVAEESIFRKNGGNIEHPATITVTAQRRRINPVASSEDQRVQAKSSSRLCTQCTYRSLGTVG